MSPGYLAFHQTAEGTRRMSEIEKKEYRDKVNIFYRRVAEISQRRKFPMGPTIDHITDRYDFKK
jgi:hypothetical protein